MSVSIKDCLFYQDQNRFNEIKIKAIQFADNFSSFNPIASNIKKVIRNYAKKLEIKLKILEIPFSDKQIWGVFFMKEDVYFVIVNSLISPSKQNFTLAHELYHIIDSKEKDCCIQPEIILKEELTCLRREDKEANVFAACLLIPTNTLTAIHDFKDPQQNNVNLVKEVMDIFAVPYKSVVIRLFEEGIFDFNTAEKLINIIGKNVKDLLEWKIDDFVMNNNISQTETVLRFNVDDLKEILEENTNMELMSLNKLSKQKSELDEIIAKIINAAKS